MFSRRCPTKKRLAAFFAIAALVVAVSIPAESQGPPEGILLCLPPDGPPFPIRFGLPCVNPSLRTAGDAAQFCLVLGGHPISVVIDGGGST